MSGSVWGIALTMCGAIVGAGFASGRELCVFFARWGAWGYAAAVCAAAVIRQVCVRAAAAEQDNDRIRKGLLILLLTSVCAAMIAGAGEVGALLLPAHGARYGAMGATLGLALAVHRRAAALPGVSGGLVLCLLAVLAFGALLPPTETVAIQMPFSAWQPPAWGICYGGFNAALAWPLMRQTCRGLSGSEARRGIGAGMLLILALLCLGIFILRRHAELQDAGLPFVEMLRVLGKPGYYLGALALYLALFTSLISALRGISALCGVRGMTLCVTAGLLLALAGLEGVVKVAYPLLGGVCFAQILLSGRRKRENPPASLL